MNKYKYLLSNSRRFHHPMVARELHQNDKLIKLVCGSPWYKLYTDVPKNLIKSCYFVNIFRKLLPKKSIFNNFDNYLKILNSINIDNNASKFVNNADVFIGLSTTGLKTGRLGQKNGCIYVCERSSSHIVFQNEIMSEEYQSLGLKMKPINPWFIERELKEYEASDIILVPSNFVKKTFSKKEINKTEVVNFGSSPNDFFFPLNNIKKDEKNFNVLFVGQISIRKGLHYLIDGFSKFNHPNKKLHIIGSNTKDKIFFQNLIKKNNINNNIILHGPKKRNEINLIMNNCQVMVLPSIEEGLAYVTKEAISAGCPVIVSENTGAKEFVDENRCGISIPIRDSQIIADKLTLLADNKDLLREYTINSINYSKAYTWTDYVESLDLIIRKIKNN